MHTLAMTTYNHETSSSVEHIAFLRAASQRAAAAHGVEEVLTVLDGCAEIWVGEEHTTKANSVCVLR